MALLIHRFDAINHALAICQYGPDGIILSANTQYLDYVGMTREELVGQPFTNLWRDAGCPADPQAHWSRFAQGSMMNACASIVVPMAGMCGCARFLCRPWMARG
jgi:PAS domain-containing protein